MQTKSLIITSVCNASKKLGAFYEKSAYHRFFCRFLDFIGSIFGKILCFLFGIKNAEKPHRNGIFSGLVNLFPSILYHIFSKPVKLIKSKSEESFIVRLFNIIFGNWHLIGINNYSTVLLAFTTVRLAILRNNGRINDKYTLILIILSCIGMLIPASFAGLYQGSVFRKHLGLYDIKGPSDLIIRIKPHIATTCGIVAGALLGLATLMPYWYVFVLGLLGILFVVAKPHLSVLIVTALLPFISPAFSLILMGVWLIRYLTRKHPHLRIDGLDICMIFVIIAFICSVIFSPVIRRSMDYAAPAVTLGALYFILRKSLAQKNNIKIFIDIIVTVCGFIALSMLYKTAFSQTLFDKDKFYLLHSFEQNLRSASSFDISPEHLFIFVLPFALCRMKMHHTFLGKSLYFVAVVFMSLCIVYISPEFTFVLAIAVTLCICSDFRRMATVFIPLLIAAVIFGIVSGKFALPSTMHISTLPISRDFLASSVFGIGLGTEALNAAYASVFGTIPPFDGTMSLYASIFFASGIWGIIIFVASMRTVFSHTVKSLRISSEKNPLSRALLISAASFVFVGFLPTATYCSTRYIIFFTLAALSGAMYDVARKKEER